MSFVICERGCRHWGPGGAAGLLFHTDDRVLLQLRQYSHHSDTWSTPGGSIEVGESPLQAALREVEEELHGLPSGFTPVVGHVADHGGWSYHTSLCAVPAPVRVRPRNWESAAAEWVPMEDVESLHLHPGFAAAWPDLRRQLRGTPQIALVS